MVAIIDANLTRVPVWTGLDTTPGVWEAWRIAVVGIAGEKGLYDLIAPGEQADVKVDSRGGSQRVRGTERDARWERSLEKTPGGLRRDDHRRDTPTADESRDAAAEEGLHQPRPGG